MNYNDAFNKMLASYSLEVLDDAILVRSILSDYIGGSVIDSVLVNALYQISRNDNLFTYVKNHSLEESKTHIKGFIYTAPRHITIEQYIESVEPLLFSIFPNTYVKRIKNNVGAKVAAINKINRQPPFTKSNQIQIAMPSPKVVLPTHTPIVQKVINSIFINGLCKELFVDCGVTDIKVLKNNKDITKKAISVIRNGTCYLKLRGKFSTFKVYLPKTSYKQIKIHGDLKKIDFACARGYNFHADELSIKTDDCFTHINCNVDELFINQHTGYIIAAGYMKKVEEELTHNKVHCYFKTSNPVCNAASLNKDQIDLEFIYYKIKPKINRLFKKIKRAKGAYYLGHQSIKLDLYCHNGRISVH